MTAILLPLYASSTATTLSVYASSISIISLMAFFSRRNKRVGWVKQREPITENLRALQEVWNEMDAAARQPARPVMPLPIVSCEQASAFTGDLARMQTALSQQGVEVGNVEQKVMV